MDSGIIFPAANLLLTVLALSGSLGGCLLGQRVVHHALHVDERSGLSGPNLELAGALLNEHF